MQRLYAAALLLAGSGSLASESVQPPECPRAELLAAASELGSQVQLPERFARREHGPITAISLHESSLASDRFRYAALVDTQQSQVWVYRYGGYDGSVAWFGPVQASVEQLASCPPALGAIWLGRNRLLVGTGGAASIPSR